MTDPTVQLDEKPELLVAHVCEPIGGQDAELPLTRGQPVRSRYVPPKPVLQLAVDPGRGVAENLLDQDSVPHRVPGS